MAGCINFCRIKCLSSDIEPLSPIFGQSFRWILASLSIIASVFIPTPTHAQIFFQDKAPFSDSTEVRAIYRAAKDIWSIQDSAGFIFHRIDILETQTDKFLLPDGKSDVYQWKNGTWTNLYKGVHHGFNYYSKKFVWRDSLYSFGGYWFWRNNGMIIKYLPDRGEWELLEFSQDFEDGTSYLHGDSLIVIEDGLRTIVNLGKRISETGTMDPVLSNVNHENIYFFECKNYIFSLYKTRILINKSTGQIYTANFLMPFPQLVKGVLSLRNFIHITEDNFTVYFKDGTTGKIESVEEEKQHFTPIKKNPSRLWIYFTGLMAIAFMAYYIQRKRSKSKSKDKMGRILNIKFDHPAILKFLTLRGNTLSMNELDEILGIDNILNPDTQKYQRMHLLNDINTEFEHKTERNLIVRVKDPEDGRRYMYRVEG